MTNCNIVNPKYHLIGEEGMNNNLLHKSTEKVGRYIILWQKSFVVAESECQAKMSKASSCFF